MYCQSISDVTFELDVVSYEVIGYLYQVGISNIVVLFRMLMF